MPPTITLIITSTQETNKMDRGPVALFHANVFKADACLKHSNFLKVKVRNPCHTVKCRHDSQEDAQAEPAVTQKAHRHPNRNPTTSFLTATTLIYAIGTGITAAAGTRLALN